MKRSATSALLGALLLPLGNALPTDVEARDVDIEARDVYTNYPYNGPEVPVGDWVDNTPQGNGKGFPRRTQPPAVTPASKNPTNNINVIQVSYLPSGVNIHFQTPFGLNGSPKITYGSSAKALKHTATGVTNTYDRTPPCSSMPVTGCNQFFHNVQLNSLKPATTYYYQIQASNGTTKSQVLKFTTGREAGDTTPYSLAILNDMGFTNAMGTHKQLINAVSDGISFAWHGGDISYADDWYSGVLECQSDWDVCYNGTDSSLPGGATKFYKNHPLPKGEIPDQGGPNGGDFSPVYESNWDLWQQWMNPITTKIPYMVLPGNHEAACAEFDGPGNIMTAYLNEDEKNSTAPKSELTYYSCPPSQRNFTAFSNRFHMPGPESGGVDNFWYSFNYGLVHFVSIDTETDYAYSPSYPFIRDTNDHGLPTPNQTYSTDAGPFGYIDGNYTNTTSYEQYHWLKSDLESVDRSKTPWVLVMGHRPMYSSQTSSYQSNLREAFESLFIANKVDVYLAGHIHWYERLFPLTNNGTIDSSAVINNNTYRSNPGTSLVHLTNGMAGNIESHSTLGSDPRLNITAYLDQLEYGFNKVDVTATKLTFSFIKGDGSGVGDYVNIVKKPSSHSRRDEPLGYQ